jgi:uncharacterized protein YqhQ
MGQGTARPYIGGQAVLEGVMMRAPTSFAIVVRRADGSLTVRERPIHDARTGPAKWPLVRGITSLVESLKLGSEALRFSGELAERDMNAADAGRAKDVASKARGAASALGLSHFALATSDEVAGAGSENEKKKGPLGFMLAVMIIFLIALPQAIAEGANRLFHLGFAVQSPAFQAITGVFKLAVVIGYMLLIRRIPEIRRVFQYHGAEHKTISTYEAGEELLVANAKKKTTLHPRCGTTFLVMVAIVSICVFTVVGSLLPAIDTGHALANHVLFFLAKLPFLPVIAAVTFELQRFFAKYCTTGPLRALLWPGFLVQKITTIEPDDDQLEVALASLKATLFRERGQERGDGGGDVTFPTYEALLGADRLRADPAQAA